jgi:hypothetical protein
MSIPDHHLHHLREAHRKEAEKLRARGADRAARAIEETIMLFDEVIAARQMRKDYEEETALREKLASLLKRTAIALKGPEPPLTWWDWSDLPEVAGRAMAVVDAWMETFDASLALNDAAQETPLGIAARAFVAAKKAASE